MPTNESIADLAYRLWIARGRPDGSADDDWLEAERQLVRTGGSGGGSHTPSSTVDSTLEDSFPASDPPASHLKDVPPANAADKWQAAGKAAEGQRSADPATVKSGPQGTRPDETKALYVASPGDPGEGP